MNKPALFLLCGFLIGTVSTFAQARKIVYCSLPADSPNPQPGCYLLATQKLNAQPARPLYWHLYTEATPDAESTVVTAFGKTWLFRIAPDDWKPSSGQRVAMVGPLMLGPATSYVARYMQSIAPIVPDSHQTPVHTHPGAEAWYVVAGAQCLQTPTGTVIVGAGQSAFVPAGIPMSLGQSGTETKKSFVLVLHDASSPWLTRTEDWKPESACPGSTGPMVANAAPPFGTWKMNMQKSHFDSPPRYRGFTLRFDPGDNGMIRVTVTVEPLDGAPAQTSSFLMREDGKDYPVTNAPFDSVSTTPVNATTTIFAGKRDGKMIEIVRRVVDGNTMTQTTISPETRHNVEVFDKQ